MPAEPPEPDLQHDLRRIAERAACAGGAVARHYFRTEFAVELKHDRSEVSDADHAAQDAILAVIRARRHDDGFITEEQYEPPPGVAPLPAPTNGRICWVVDPIDGTRNFVRGIPIYTCVVAAMIDGAPLVGAIFSPEDQRLYSGSRAAGLFVDGMPFAGQAAAATRPPDRNPRPVVGFPSMPAGDVKDMTHAWLERFVSRNLGSTALHLALVATGELDGMLTDNARLWDIAAGCLLVEVAGGRISTPHGDPLFPLDVAHYDRGEMPTLAGVVSCYDDLRAACDVG
jgi:fructose-1,6-bisphosphatase/inositol monophosphatase family enzyme